MENKVAAKQVLTTEKQADANISMGNPSAQTTEKANTVEKKDPYDIMVELAAEYGEENHDIVIKH